MPPRQRNPFTDPRAHTSGSAGKRCTAPAWLCTNISAIPAVQPKLPSIWKGGWASIARGTNPQEGAALARALVQYLGTLDCVALMTTRYDGVSDVAGAHYQVAGLVREIQGDVSIMQQIKRPIGNYFLHPLSSLFKKPLSIILRNIP